MSPSLPESASHVVHVARQGILDARGHVIGYELLYRGGSQSIASAVDADLAGARLLADSVLDLRLDTITDGRTAFINLTRSLLLNGAATLLRPEVAVFELRGDIGIDADVFEACHSLSSAGFRLALDDFLPGSPAEALLPYAAFVKVDVTSLAKPDVRLLAARLAARGLPLVAQKVEHGGVRVDARRGMQLLSGAIPLPTADALWKLPSGATVRICVCCPLSINRGSRWTSSKNS